MTLPTSYWYLRHFDVKSLQQYVDWFNLMAYDLHGVWDAQSQFVGPYIAPHTNLTEIDQGLDLLWRAGVKANKVVSVSTLFDCCRFSFLTSSAGSWPSLGMYEAL